MELILIVTLCLSFFVLIYFVLIFTYAVNNDIDEFWKISIIHTRAVADTHITMATLFVG